MTPAYDMTFSYRKDSIWVNAHQMLINGKADGILDDDLLQVADKVGIKKSDARRCIEEVRQPVLQWEAFAQKAGLSEVNFEKIKRNLNLQKR